MIKTEISANCFAFLNGEYGLHDTDQNLFDKFTSEGKKCIVVDGLFTFPDRMKLAVGAQCWVVSSTGFRPEKLIELFDYFESLNYLPKDVIILLNEEPFVTLAFKYASKIKFHGLMLGGWNDKDSWTYHLDYIKPRSNRQ